MRDDELWPQQRSAGTLNIAKMGPRLARRRTTYNGVHVGAGEQVGHGEPRQALGTQSAAA